ncbi:MAG: hypothetical protein WD071_03080 [Pseudohongiella sp.]|uniref:hypothetical protein n=1 Tax=Pseudohongiella sp. TaxID=1979412 RepID=UPI0034A0A2D5
MQGGKTANSDKISGWVWLALAVLILLALAVVFVLPRLVQEYELPLVKRAEPAPVVTSNTLSTPATPDISPFEEAQRARQRREAQDVLASLLERQSALDEMDVGQWAATDYEAALAAARRGDEFYRSGEFTQAALAYQESDMALSALQDKVPEVFNDLIAEGNSALDAPNSAQALDSFALAMRLDPDSQIAQQGFARAQTLDEVEALIASGEVLQEQGDLAAAQQQFEQAAALDSAHQRAAEQVASNRRMITDANYTAVMSEGFALLQQNQTDAAIAAFERALRIKPGSDEATEAIAQTREQLTLASIDELREQAEAFEAAEDWEQAVAAYDSALAMDSNLVFALEGRDYSARRLQLDRLLSVNIEHPERLSDQAAYDEAREVYGIGRDLEADLLAEQGTVGERLSQQLETMEELLAQMQIPVEVTLISDNATDVTVYQVGQLGAFAETTLMLRPGRYVAVGTRPGYRDVRKEFVVGFGRDLSSLTIRCNEEVAAVNRP